MPPWGHTKSSSGSTVVGVTDGVVEYVVGAVVLRLVLVGYVVGAVVIGLVLVGYVDGTVGLGLVVVEPYVVGASVVGYVVVVSSVVVG